MKARFNMAQDAGSSGFVPEIDDDDATPFGEKDITARGQDDDVEYIIEGSPEAAALAQQGVSEPEEYKGKSREDILAELQAQRAALQAAQSAHEPVTALKDTLSQFLQAQQPKPQPVTKGYAVQPIAPQVDPAQLEKRLNDTFMENPYRGFAEGFNVQVAPLLQVMAQNQAQMIVSAASEQVNEYNRQAQAYLSDMLAHLEQLTQSVISDTNNVYQSTLQSMNSYLQNVQNDRNALLQQQQQSEAARAQATMAEQAAANQAVQEAGAQAQAAAIAQQQAAAAAADNQTADAEVQEG